MKKKMVIKKLRRCFRRIGDDTYNNFPIHDVVPDKEGQMGFFFVSGNTLFCGEMYGDPFFCRLGDIKSLRNILYRVDISGEVFCLEFLFSGYQVWVVFGENMTTTVSILDECQCIVVLEDCELWQSNVINGTVESLEKA